MTYYVWCPYDGETREDARCIETIEAEYAAMDWARDDDQESATYRIVGGKALTVHVEDEHGVVTRWVVTGESVPMYSARRVAS